MSSYAEAQEAFITHITNIVTNTSDKVLERATKSLTELLFSQHFAIAGEQHYLMSTVWLPREHMHILAMAWAVALMGLEKDNESFRNVLKNPYAFLIIVHLTNSKMQLKYLDDVTMVCRAFIQGMNELLERDQFQSPILEISDVFNPIKNGGLHLSRN